MNTVFLEVSISDAKTHTKNMFFARHATGCKKKKVESLSSDYTIVCFIATLLNTIVCWQLYAEPSIRNVQKDKNLDDCEYLSLEVSNSNVKYSQKNMFFAHLANSCN